MLNVSIVIYKHKWDETESLILSLQQSKVVANIYIVDNSPVPSNDFKREGLIYIFTGKNLGYGAGHNIAIRKSMLNNIAFHLVVNPDITLEPCVLVEMLTFMQKNPEVGHLMPKIVYPNGEIQYLCKLLPTPVDLFFRRFLPARWTAKRMRAFEMRDTGYAKIMDVPYLSGCFMLLRTEALKRIGLFDERFFMYPEDIDLTRRIGEQYRTIFYPMVSVVHHHAKSSYTNFNMMLIHSWNLVRYFNKWGWIFDKKRRAINHKFTKF